MADVEGAVAAASWAPPEIKTTLVEGLRAARGAWPEIRVSLPAVLDHVRARCTDAAPTAARVRDLYLAFACAAGDAAALRAFDRDVLAPAGAALRRMGRGADFAAEMLQRARERILVRPAGGRPRIDDYAGHGDLRRWVRVVVVRCAQEVLRARGDPPIATENAAELKGRDLELDLLRARYGGWFSAALGRALRALSSDDRRLVTLHFRDGLSLGRLGRQMGVSKSTLSRRLAGARARVLAEIERLAREELHLRRAEYESLLRLVQSQLDVSLGSTPV